jgi:hypothetical protein
MQTSYRLRPLTAPEVSAMNGYTHIFTVTAGDLTLATVTTTQTLEHGPIPKGSKIQVELRNTIPFQNTADNTNNTTGVSVGDGVGVATVLANKEVNLNGSEIVDPQEGTLSAAVYTADDILKTTWTPKSGTALLALNKGQIDVLVRIVNPNPLMDVKGAVSFAK